MNHHQDAEQKMRTARVKLSNVRPYFTIPAYALVLVPSEECESFAVDRYKRVYYNPNVARLLSTDQLVTVLLHEMGHPLMSHHERAVAAGVTSLTHAVANCCQDAELDDDLRDQANAHEISHLPDPIWDEEAMALPEEMRGPIYPWKLGCEDYQPWEVYYRSVMSRRFDTEQSNGPVVEVPVHTNCGSGAHGVPAPWELGSPEESGVEGLDDADWKSIQHATAKAIEDHQKRRGDVPGMWVEWATDMLRTKPIPWPDLLTANLRWAVETVRGYMFHTYTRPSRRASVLDGVVLPTMRSYKPFVCIVGDTSGSMSRKDLSLVRGIVEDVVLSMGATVAFLATDAAVHGGVQMASGGRDVTLAGRGGTNMAVGIDYAMTQLVPRPDVLIVCTDCETPWPEHRPDATTIICAIGAHPTTIETCPEWATVIQVEEEET